MAKNRYPIGIQTFEKLIEGGFTYVDKTRFIAQLVKEGQYIFLSRPRRFGKSLLLSTMESYFEGRRDLFKGLAIDNMDMDWTPRPVLYIDFNTGSYDQPDGLHNRMITTLIRYEDKYGITPTIENDVALRFENLINGIYERTGQKVIILVDEYDKPLLDVEEDMDLFEKNQSLLKRFFSNVKSTDRYIEFAMLTGVSRFSKVSIFSDLNNLKDISMYDRYQEICGWTEEELTSYFKTGIVELAQKRRESPHETLNNLRNYYDGYLFSEEGKRLYNPFSVLMALDSQRIMPYWFGTGTPTFLVKRIKAMGMYPPDINGKLCTENELLAVGLNAGNPIPLMFQTGYLTIASYINRLEMYELRFPNREVETGFYEDLLQLYVPATNDFNSPFNFKLFKIDLFDGRPKDFMKRLSSLIKDLPTEDHKESSYRAITYLLTVLCGAESIAEHHGYIGRSDIEVIAGEYIYIFEFKYNKSVEDAMEQICSRDYAGRYAMDSRKVYLIGANFNEDRDKRGLEYEIKELKDT
ncbi:MAG: ATP-binding protein [Muribaculaceae bacterium]|nr:ATP-binding protein [Muribaculaceae bacterium]